MDLVLILVVAISFGFAIYYISQTYKYRKAQQFGLMKYVNAKANIAMGISLIALALIQGLFLLVEDELSFWRIGVGVVFIALGIFNFYMGIRHLNEFRPAEKERPQK